MRDFFYLTANSSDPFYLLLKKGKSRIKCQCYTEV
jgi:hypothetical protein